MGILSLIWACPLQVGLRLQVLATLWAFHLRPHAFFFLSILFLIGFQPQKNSQKGQQFGLCSIQQGYNKRTSCALASMSLFSPFILLSFFSFFLLGLCVCGGWGWSGVVVFLLFFVFCCHGGLFIFFVLFSCVRFRASRWRCFVRLLRFAFRCSSFRCLGRGAGFASCFLLGFLRLCGWSLRPCSFLFSVRVCVPCFRFRWWSFGVRSSFGGARSVCCCFPSSALGFFPCSSLSCGARSFRFPFSLLRWLRFGVVGFRCSCCGVGRSFACLASCWGCSSCFVGLRFVGWWLLSPPLV